MSDDDRERERERAEAAAFGAILDRHAAQLSEHFSTVQIIVTTESPDATGICWRGEGNHFARVESAAEFVRHARRRGRQAADDDGE